MVTLRKIFLCLLGTISVAGGEYIRLPTPNQDTRNGLLYLQPTGPGLNNGSFGMVRENGHRFHAGIDIRPTAFRPNGEPADQVFAVAAGVVEYVNFRADSSDYGIYVLILHDGWPLAVTSHYAHLAAVREGIAPGVRVAAGECIGTLGRTSGSHTIPQAYAHLHFSMGFRLGGGEEFNRWYRSEDRGGSNGHGAWNLLNYATIDPLPLLRSADNFSFPEAVDALPTAFTTRVATNVIPDFLRRHPALWKNRDQGWLGGMWGFDIEWTAHGLPKAWTSVHSASAPAIGAVPDPLLLHWRSELLDLSLRRGTLALAENGSVRLGPCTVDTLKKIFGDGMKKLDSTAGGDRGE